MKKLNGEKRDCPCQYCKCTTTSMNYLKDPCGFCLARHEEYNNYEAGLGIKENTEQGNIPTRQFMEKVKN
jgi:hypothetical protein